MFITPKNKFKKRKQFLKLATTCYIQSKYLISNLHKQYQFLNPFMNEQPRPEQNPRQAQTAAEKKKRINQEYKKISEQQRKRWMPLVRYMKKYHIKFKTARCQTFRVEYFRTDELQALITQNKENLEKDPSLSKLINSWNKDVVYFQRPETSQKLKYPKELEKLEGNAVSKFASFKFDSAEPKTWLFPVIILGAIAVVLFPLWPYALKYAIFMISLVLVISLLSIIVLRLVVYLIFAVFGISFWILPNFFEDVTITQSFVPVYDSKKWEGGVFSIIGRLLALSILVYYGYHAYVDPSWIYENVDITKTSMEDLHDWGVGKIKGEKNFSQSALTNLDHIMNQTAELNVDESVDLENTENLENTEDLENQESTKDLENQESTENTENTENLENAEDLENTQNENKQQEPTEDEEKVQQEDIENSEEKVEVRQEATENGASETL